MEKCFSLGFDYVGRQVLGNYFLDVKMEFDRWLKPKLSGFESLRRENERDIE